MKKQTIYTILGVIIILGVLFLAYKKSHAPEVATPVTTVAAPTVINVVYTTNAPFTPATVQVKEGDTATIRVTSDVADELHFHGYDLHTDLQVGVPGEITFVANKTGRFEFELESLSKTLGYVEVYPK